mgnify:CR=1 FL=1
MPDLPPLARLPLLVLGMLSLLGGVLAGLARLDWTMPAIGAGAAGWHGALMISAFLGTVISLERAVAIGRIWAYLAPACAGLGGIALLAGAPLTLAQGLGVAAAFVLLAASGSVLQRLAAPFTLLLAIAALCWLIGNALWFHGAELHLAVPWWLAFLVLTIFGERRELARFVPLSEKARRGYIAMVVVQVGALVVLAVPWHEHPIAGGLWWLSMSLFSGWLLRYDLACRPKVHRFGWALHTARSLRLGYTWLMLAGLWGVVNALRGMPLDSPGPLHMLLLGFVFSMVFGHAPIMLPALLRTPISPPGPFAFVPVGLMTLGVTLRAVGDAIGSSGVRAGAGALQAAAILTFAFTMIRHLRR